jgi:hypothetical protein
MHPGVAADSSAEQAAPGGVVGRRSSLALCLRQVSPRTDTRAAANPVMPDDFAPAALDEGLLAPREAAAERRHAAVAVEEPSAGPCLALRRASGYSVARIGPRLATALRQSEHPPERQVRQSLALSGMQALQFGEALLRPLMAQRKSPAMESRPRPQAAVVRPGILPAKVPQVRQPELAREELAVGPS